MAPRVSVVIPAMNEARNLPWVLDRLPAGLHEVVLVDGNSTDDTIDVARRHRPDIRVVSQVARGKGAALVTGFLAATGDVIVMIDADGSMDPQEIDRFVAALVAGADLVKGSRYAPGGGSRDLSRLRGVGNRALTALANVLYGQTWSELCYGYAAFWSDLLPKMDAAALAGGAGTSPIRWPAFGPGTPAYGHGFEIEAVLFCRAVLAGSRIAEVGSFEEPRRFGESNLATFRDGTRVLGAVCRERRRGGDRRRQPRSTPDRRRAPVGT